MERVIRELLGSRARQELIREVRFVDGGTYPLTLTDIGDIGPLDSVFAENETPTQSRRQPAITGDIAGAFGHLGWSYSVVSGVPFEKLAKLVPIMAFMQFNYFQITYFRHYGLETMQTAGRKETRHALEQKSARFEQLVFHFQRFVLESEQFRSALHPICGDAAKWIEDYWNLTTGVEAVRQAFETQRDFLQSRFARAEEKVIKRQSVYLYVIALVGLLGLYGVVEGILGLWKTNPLITHSITGTCAVGLILGLWLLLRPERPT